MSCLVNDEYVTGCRVTLLFEGGVPEIGAPEVKALLDPILDFGVKSSAEAYADSLPVFLKDAIAQHDVLVGMNRKMVLAAMGAPESKMRELVPGSSRQALRGVDLRSGTADGAVCAPRRRCGDAGEGRRAGPADCRAHAERDAGLERSREHS